LDQDPRAEAVRLSSGAAAAQRAVGSTALDTSGRLAARRAAQGRLRAGERRRAPAVGGVRRQDRRSCCGWGSVAGSGEENAGEGEDSMGKAMAGSKRRGGGRSLPIGGGVRA